MKLRYGPDSELEELATEILKEDRRRRIFEAEGEREPRTKWGARQPNGRCGKKSSPETFCYDEINDWFTEDQWELRTSREILNSIGIADASYLRGQYSRVYNPEINRRPGPKHLLRPGMDPWRQQLWEEVEDWSYHPGRMCYPRPEKVGWF